MVDLQAIDSKIRKLQKLRELLADDDTRALLADPETMAMLRLAVISNGSATLHKVEETDDVDQSEEYLPAEGSFKRKVLDTARTQLGRFDTRQIVEKLQLSGHNFGARDPMLAVNQVLRSLTKRKLVRLVRKGSGRMPHIYENRPKEVAA